MRKLHLLVLSIILLQSTVAQKYLKITNGFSSVQIKISADQSSKLYYVLYKVAPTTDPTPAELKTLVGNATTTNIERKGTVSIIASTVGDTLTQSLINIPNVTSNTPKILYMYTVYENSTGTLEAIVKQTLTFKRKQPAYTFQSTTLSTTSLTTVNYLVYLPESYYHDNKNKKYPLIVFFHGDGQKGDNVDQVRTDALPNYLDGTLNIDFIVVSPQQNGWKQTWTIPSFVDELVTLTKSTYRVDSEKIYGIGCSGGGGGLYTYSSKYPNTFSGMSPMSGVNSLTTPDEYCAMKDIPFWGFHSTLDNTINLNNLDVVMNSLNTCGPIIPLKKTIYKGNIHDCWQYPLKQDSLYRYFLARNLTNKKNDVTPIAFDTNLTVSKDAAGRAVINFPALVNNSEFEYFWYQKSGSDVLLTDQDTRTPALLNPSTGGVYKFRLILKKPNGNTNYRDVVITVSNVVTSIDDKEISMEKPFKNWSLYDISGQKIREGNDSKVNFSNLTNGIYIVNNEEGQFKIFIH